MIRIRLAELVATKTFALGRRLEMGEVADATGIHRSTLSKMLHTRGYNLTASNIDRLCRFFDCQVQDVLVYVRDEDVPGEVQMSSKGPVPHKAPSAGGTKKKARKPSTKQ